MDEQNRKDKLYIKRIIMAADGDAANELINAYYPIVYGFIVRQMRDLHISMDITQDTFIAMLRGIESYDYRKATFKTWLLTIANNKVIDYYRSKYYKIQLISDDLAALNIADTLYKTDDRQRELEEMALSFLEKFSAESQQIVRLKIFAELTFAEIANLLKLPESTVKSKYYAAIRMLRQLMEENV